MIAVGDMPTAELRLSMRLSTLTRSTLRRNCYRIAYLRKISLISFRRGFREYPHKAKAHYTVSLLSRGQPRSRGLYAKLSRKCPDSYRPNASDAG
jgi:hypothetical protein